MKNRPNIGHDIYNSNGISCDRCMYGDKTLHAMSELEMKLVYGAYVVN